MSGSGRVAAARVAQFAARVLQDALSEATVDYWERRARTFEDAAPRPGDFTGRASAEDLEASAARCRLAAQVCRQRASLERPGQPIEPEVWLVLGDLVAS